MSVLHSYYAAKNAAAVRASGVNSTLAFPYLNRRANHSIELSLFTRLCGGRFICVRQAFDIGFLNNQILTHCRLIVKEDIAYCDKNTAHRNFAASPRPIGAKNRAILPAISRNGFRPQGIYACRPYGRMLQNSGTVGPAPCFSVLAIASLNDTS